MSLPFIYGSKPLVQLCVSASPVLRDIQDRNLERRALAIHKHKPTTHERPQCQVWLLAPPHTIYNKKKPFSLLLTAVGGAASPEHEDIPVVRDVNRTARCCHSHV